MTPAELEALAADHGWRVLPCGLWVNEWFPDDTAAQIGPAAPIVLIGRSAGHDADAIDDAASNAYAAASRLATCGLDTRQALPPVAALRRGLASSADVVISRERATRHEFRHTFAEFDLRDRGVFLLLGLGNTFRYDEDGRHPFVERLADLIRRVTPVGVFASDLSRLARSDASLQPVLRAAAAVRKSGRHKPFVGLSPNPWSEQGGFTQLEVLRASARRRGR
jgi:hypothetical protein